MAVTVLNYSAPRNDGGRKAKRRDDSWRLVGAVISFLMMVGVMVAMVGNPLRILNCATNTAACGGGMKCSTSCAMHCWRSQASYSVAQQTVLFLCGVLLLLFAEWLVSRHYNSSSFARGALIGGLLPGGMALCFLAARVFG